MWLIAYLLTSGRLFASAILDLFYNYTMIDQKDIDNVFVKYVKEYQGTL